MNYEALLEGLEALAAFAAGGERPAFPTLCGFEYHAGSYYDPPEYCENEVVEDSEYCAAHID